jgi:hypothetical protein
MKKRGVSRKFLTVALALGLLANAGGKPAFAKDREVVDKGDCDSRLQYRGE